MEGVVAMQDKKRFVDLSEVVRGDPDIEIGAHTCYQDLTKDPRDFVKNNILYHMPAVHRDRIVIGSYSTLASGVKFICPIANHYDGSLAWYPFPIMAALWGLDESSADKIAKIKGPTIVGSDVFIGYEAVIMPGVTIGDGAIIGARSIVTKDIPPYAVAAGDPAAVRACRFDEATIARLLKLRWWDWPEEQIRRAQPFLQSGDLDALEAMRA